eukprot:3250612-Pleurochrysis_carterae.AAC.1
MKGRGRGKEGEKGVSGREKKGARERESGMMKRNDKVGKHYVCQAVKGEQQCAAASCNVE